jgi:eukaryotic-like serine/threonine-protein kinase
MNTQRLRELEQVFLEALECPAGAQRDAFLAKRCGSDSELYTLAQKLLTADSAQGASLVNSPGQPQIEELPRFGGFQSRRILGRGGSGTVYLCQRVEPGFEQLAAVKLIHSPIGPQGRSFLRERRVLASLRHPGIATLIDAGVHLDGAPYIVMEYVEGERLDDYCRKNRLTLTQRLALFRSVCAAVAYSHRNLVAHLDIKPSNILVTAEGQTKLLDFGTAKMLGPEDSAVTQSSATPRYASPEQLRGESAGPLSDVYSLGIVLAELVTGEWPFGDPDSRRESLRRAMEDVEPVPLAKLVGVEHAQLCRITERQLKSAVEADLTAIVQKALRSDPEQRYHSVEQLAADVEHYSRSEPVSARPASPMYRGRKFVRRHPWNVAFAALFLGGMIGALLFSLRQAEIARKQALRAEHINTFLTDLLGSPNPSWYNTLRNRGRDVTVVEFLGEMTQRLGKELSGEPDVEVELRRVAGRMYATIGDHKAAREQLTAAIEKQRTMKDAPRLETAKLYVARATEDYMSGRPTETLADGRAAIQILDRTGGSRNRDEKQTKMEALNAIGSGSYSLGMLAETETAMKHSLQLSRELFGNGGGTPVNLGNIGTIYLTEGKLAEAKSVLREVLTIYQAQSDQRNEVLFVWRDLGLVCLEEGDFACAEEYFGRALVRGEEKFGSNGVYTILLHATHGAALSGLKQFGQGLAEIREARKRMVELGSDSVNVAPIDGLLGRAEAESSDFTEAEIAFRRAYDKYRQAYTSSDPRLLNVESRLGECLSLLGRQQEAKPLLEESYQTLNQQFGEANVFTRNAKIRLEQVRSRLAPK